MTDDLVLRATNLGLGYGGKPIFTGANFEIRRGERWFIVGPNGQGKTTLMRGLLGLLPAHPAQLWRSPEFMRPDRLGFVPQRCDLNPAMPTTVREFVTLGAVGQRVSRAERESRLHWALQQVNLLPKIDTDYWSLSGGQRQRALVARALVRKPAVLMLDEPSSGLDLTSEDILMRALADLNHRENLTMLLISHNVELAARFGTHAALVWNGGIVAGRIDDVFKPDLLEKAYQLPIEVLSHEEGAVSLRVGRAIGEVVR